MSSTHLAIIGYGNLGNATHTFVKKHTSSLEDSYKWSLVDIKSPLKKFSKKPVHILFVCIDLVADDARTAELRIFSAILRSGLTVNKKTRVVVRTTVPIGTCDLLEKTYPDVHYIPEFATEENIRANKLLPLFIGRPLTQPSYFLPMSSELAVMFLTPFTENNRLVEYAKLAANVKRAADVSIRNELVEQASRLGLDTVLAENCLDAVYQNIKSPTFGSWTFEGRCLRKDLDIWNSQTDSEFGKTLLKLNDAKYSKVLGDLHTFLYHYKMSLGTLGVIGLGNSPGSKQVTMSPASNLLLEVSPLYRRTIALGPTSQTKQLNYPEDTDLYDDVNVVVIAQKSVPNDRTIVCELLNVLKHSKHTLKLVFNPSHCFLDENDMIEAIQWGAIFVDLFEIKRLSCS